MAKTTTETKSLINKGLKYDPLDPNKILDLSQFEWKGKLEGEDFKSLLSLLEELSPELGIAEHTNSNFWFELHWAKPIYTERYPGIPNSPKDLTGIEFKTQAGNGSLRHTTKIAVRHARDLNSQIENAHSVAGFGSFYVPAKKSYVPTKVS